MYHDNIQEYVSQAAAANFNQANSGYRPSDVPSHQIRPPGFSSRFIYLCKYPKQLFNRGNNYQSKQRKQFQNQVRFIDLRFITSDFERYVTANDAVLRNMQNQGQNLQSQMANLTDMLSKFVTANTASTSGSGTLPGNTITNPKEDLKGITTRSGVTIQGPKAVNHDTEVTKDTMPPANNGSTEDVQPPVVQIQSRNPNPEPNVAPVVTPVPKASIPFPSRRNDEKRKEKANDQIEKFYEIFRDLSFEISFTGRHLMPCLNLLHFKNLDWNKKRKKTPKEKLSELARTPLNENWFSVISTSLPKKLGDPGRFPDSMRILRGLTTCNALPNLGVPRFSNVIASGKSHSIFLIPIVSTLSHQSTPFGDSDFLYLKKQFVSLPLEDDPTSSEVELKELPPHLEYAFLEGDDKLPVIIAKDLKDEEKAALLKVLKMARYVSDYRKLNEATEKDHFLYHSMDQMARETSRKRIHCFLDAYWVISRFPIDPKGSRTDNLHMPYGTFAYLACLFGRCNAPGYVSPKIAKGVEVIAKLPHPTSVKGVRSFLGHACFYRRFIQDFSKIDRPMTHLLEKDTPFFFSEECVDSFNTLKRKLTEAPILIAPDWDLPFKLMCDASDFAIGAVLGQRKNKHFQPIHYASKTMNEAQTHGENVDTLRI
ncbi:reverse transcriptase domain-containing protein [Tanacetum coccineum]